MDGVLHRMAHFRPLTGILERALTACAFPDRVLPRTISAVLTAAVDKVGAIPMTAEIAGRLSVGDRVFLMVQLAMRHVGDLVWLPTICEQCASPFDIPAQRSKLSVRSPEGNYPKCTVQIRRHVVELKPPCGDDQCFIAETRPEDPESALLVRCIKLVDGGEPDDEFLQKLTISERRAIEAALMRCSPEVDCSVPVKCPECKTVQTVEIEPYWLGDRIGGALETDVHTLAFHYHWCEHDILNLPSELRRRYVSLVSKERGLRG